ncbi:MAG TPA: aminomethyl-transferring glycine dehydrogenase, partial [Bacteroidota bacterium]|nr:aminomethyl-transferring glycine dehydrogenase [Bacteroidota bacterium]
CGPDAESRRAMLAELGSRSLDEFIAGVVPPAIRSARPLAIGEGRTEEEVIAALGAMASRNRVCRSFIGTGYHDTVTPAVILRNVLENPGWYTAYTPYQAEIAQGRLEALLNFQTMVTDFTGMDIANASLLDESTAAAEAMTMFYAIKGHPAGGVFFVSDECHPQNIEVVRTRAGALGIRIVVGSASSFEFSDTVFGALIQYPATDGAIHDYRPFCDRAHEVGALVAAAADIMSLALLAPPSAFGADAAVGSTQRFGIPMGYGGPHAAYFATKDEHRRHMPGRIIGVSQDAQGNRALRMALQTREQHIRREKATSNVCTSQVLLAVMAGMYAVYHGPGGIRSIAGRMHALAGMLARGAASLGHTIVHDDFFDTVRLRPKAGSLEPILRAAANAAMNFRRFPDGTLGIALDELADGNEVLAILGVLAGGAPYRDGESLRKDGAPYGGPLARTTPYLTHPVFHRHRSETAMLRYIHSLEAKDLALNVSMIPLGSCTMKLNATTEMIPVTWPAFGRLHPFAPADQAAGYHAMFGELASWLGEITGFAAVSFQPNAGAQGEYTGLLVIRAWHRSRKQDHRTVCLIPSSAHGTNPASAVMAGMQVVVVRCDEAGNIDVRDLEAKAREHASSLAALMVTYPSTHGVFEESIRDICRIVHENGGEVYMDGANMNAQVGLCRPAELGADVCHLNLHKTFCIPHGGGGPGMGPIAVAEHLSPFLPVHPALGEAGAGSTGPVSAAPWGSASILTISWAYIAMMGGRGLTEATEIAILNANYMAKRLEGHYPILYRGAGGRVAHEFIVDLRGFKESAGVEAEDVAKRLMDYGFHAPTVSFPVAGTLMIEPTESESKEELDRFCDALVAIRDEIREIEQGTADRIQNVLKNAPHTASAVTSDAWTMPYGREKAAFPTPYVRAHKFWPAVARVNNAYGDRNLICTCPPVEEYAEA